MTLRPYNILESSNIGLRSEDPNHIKSEVLNYFIESLDPASQKELFSIIDMIEIIRLDSNLKSNHSAIYINDKPYELINMKANLLSFNDIMIKTLFSHTNILKIIGILESQQQIFIVQELKLVSLKSHSLSKRCNWKKIMIDLISVIIFLVSKSVFEVSLDPEHLVVESGSIGIKYLNGYHLQNENYQAPEFMHSRLVNQSSLVWTLGCVLVFLLTGSEPFQSTGKGFLKFEVLDKDFRARTLDNEKLAEVREILQKIFKIKQSRRISIEMLLVLIQNI